MSSGTYNKYTGYHNRRSTRLREYDYSRPGYYFVTVCVHDRAQPLFGDIFVGPGPGSVGAGSVGAGSKPAPAFRPNQFAEIVQRTWNDLPNHIHGIQLDEFIIMPNHIHGIVRIVGIDGDPARLVPPGSAPAGLEPGAGLEPAPTGTRVGLGEIVRQLKTFSARRINAHRNTAGRPVWQRNYYDHIIRDENSLRSIRGYIRENPGNWANDSGNHLGGEIEQLAYLGQSNGPEQ